MTIDQFVIMAGSLQLGLHLATLAYGLSLAGILTHISERVSMTNLMVITYEVIRRGWLGVALMIASTFFTVLHRGSTMITLLSFVVKTDALTLLDNTLFPFVVTVLQFAGVFILRDVALDCYHLNNGVIDPSEEGGHDY